MKLYPTEENLQGKNNKAFMIITNYLYLVKLFLQHLNFGTGAGDVAPQAGQDVLTECCSQDSSTK
jgi:hypothetical protein